LVLITLPLVSLRWTHWSTTVRAAVDDGTPDPSPNAGLSESIFAHCAGVQLGGLNRYGNTWINKPLLSAKSGKATASGVRKMLNLGLKLEVAWLVVAAGWSFLQ
jgi:adenosylcobinamide-phosphate synthase